jgi:hypothetical protein
VSVLREGKDSRKRVGVRGCMLEWGSGSGSGNER